MTMQVVRLQAQASQIVTAALGGQNCGVTVYQKATGLFLDLSVDGTLIIGGVQCRNLRKIVIDAYLGFSGDIGFFDTQGTSDPDWTGLGGRFVLLYQSP